MLQTEIVFQRVATAWYTHACIYLPASQSQALDVVFLTFLSSPLLSHERIDTDTETLLKHK